MEQVESLDSVPFELQSLANAHRYQRWLYSSVERHLGNRILELGSGIGNLSQHLPVRDRLILSDLEESFVASLKRRPEFSQNQKISVLRLQGLSGNELDQENLDTIVSFNVMEHVENDSALLGDAIRLLKKSNATGPKRIVSLVPAHQWAFGEIDKKFGHYRRYSDKGFRAALQKAGAAPLNRANYQSYYMNLPALLAWWLKGRILRQKDIGLDNMKVFELLCPLIKPVDNFLHQALGLPVGNSLITVYRIDNA